MRGVGAAPSLFLAQHQKILSSILFSSFFVPEPGTYVKQALRSVGRITETTGYLAHEIQVSKIWDLGFLRITNFLI